MEQQKKDIFMQTNNDINKYEYNADGQIHGKIQWYWLNGNLMHKGEYINDERVGLWKWYHKNGNLRETKYYAR
jgi:antitoxin component YwqK of YwqJK toxin-antitoxin module